MIALAAAGDLFGDFKPFSEVYTFNIGKEDDVDDKADKSSAEIESSNSSIIRLLSNQTLSDN